MQPVTDSQIDELLRSPRLERAIGVLYLPETERQSHYFRCTLSKQFDAVFHFDRTRALEPLDNVSRWTGTSPETYPFGV
ncbi:erythromycin esterase family protein [Marinimicrobium sp. C2-29]|uniref:erythromycin esterase family protein n=1 Tax=Marinimicrobium sp. C2-29 TaxID=3139825 RepID=UPI00313896A2